MNKKRSVFQFEMESEFSFPAIAAIIGTFLVAGMYSALTHSFGNITISGPDIDRLELISNAIKDKGLSVIVTSAANFIFPLMVIVPLIVGFTFAGGYDTGLLRTLLSFPIKRSDLFLLKYVNIVFWVGIAAIIGCISSVFFFVPFFYGIGSAVVVLVSLWVHISLAIAIAFLFAVLSRNPLATSFGSLAVMFGSFFLVNWLNAPPLMKMILFLPGVIGKYIGTGPIWVYVSIEITFIDVILAVGMSCFLIIIILAVSYTIFNKSGV